MFNSSKIGDSPRANKSSPHLTMNETANGIPRSFLHPKITSTPLGRRDSIFATPPKPHPLSPRRYSLSEIATPPRQPNKKDLTRIHTTGPLLASTKYNVSVSTYEDTKSPGLAGRIVQYNEETERERERQKTPTHQAKYGSPGLFPVVHLFKKKLPVLEQKPRRVTIRIASPEYSRQHSQEYNRKLLEGIIKPNSPNNSRRLLASPSGGSNNSGTRSVLDALKEISRKRIHANEEYELKEDSSKRIRTENFIDTDSNKRTRDDSPLLDTASSPTKPGSKRICMYDEYAASCSSMNFSFKKSDQSVPKRKSISISTGTENLKESKQVKLINVETQTILVEDGQSMQPSKVTTEADTNQNQKPASEDTSLKKKESPVKIFDDAPLERIRKNRLAALMGSLAGKDPVLTPKPDYATALNSNSENPEVSEISIVEVPKTTDKPLISILASPKKDSPIKSTKHVHFSIPESTSQTILSTPSITGFSITQSSTSITSPISSACEVKTSFGQNKNEEKLETPAPPSSPVGLTPTSSDTTIAVPAMIFGSGSNSSSATSIVSKESSTLLLGANMSKSDSAVPNFQFQAPTTSSAALGAATSNMSFSSSSSTPSQITFGTAITSAPTNTTSPPKMGGFKFNLGKPAVTSSAVTTSATPTFSFGAASQSKPLFETPITTTSVAASSLGTLGGFSFGANSTSLTPSTSTATSSFPTGNAFAIAATAPPDTSIVPAFKFGPSNADNKPAGLGFGLTSTSAVTFGSPSTAPSALTFGAKTPTVLSVSAAPTNTAPAFDASKSSVFSFGAPNAPAKPSGFGIATTTSVPLTFGAPSTTASSGFGASPASGFGTPSTGFGVTTTASAMTSFGVPSTTISGGFATSAAPTFGDNKSASPFGITTSTTPIFGTSSASNSTPFGKSITSTFGQNATQPSFGAPTTTVSFGTANAFAGTPTTSSSVFEGPTSSSGFGKPTNTSSIFGGVANTQPSGFGATNSKPLFGAATSSPFGSSAPATTAPAFGNKTTPTFNFGAKTTASSTFGTGNVFGTTTAASGGFGTTTTSAFGSSNMFGSGSSNFGANNAFGSSTTPTFGAATTTTQSTGFGTANATPAFGSPDGDFGASNKSSVFGNSTTSAFGVPSNTSAFGTNTASAFAKPQTAFGPASNAFGANTNFGASQPQASSFGATSPLSTQSPVFSFGAAAAPKPAGVFSFGAAPSSEPPKPSFNFTGGSSAPGFGSAGAPSFGNTGTPSFGAGGVPQFNASQPTATGMFSIGSGSSSGRTRTQLKAKRRT